MNRDWPYVIVAGILALACITMGEAMARFLELKGIR